MTRRKVLITGVCGGIGHGIAKAFTAAGWHVIGIDQSGATTELAVDEFVLADLADDDGVATVCDRLSHVNRLDSLVNNAALQIDKPLLDTTDDEWSSVMNTNLRAAFRLTRDFHPALAAARGAIVNVSSIHAIATSINVAAYAISKGALVALTRTTALEFAADGIRCNAVLPGAIMTPILESGLSRRPHPDGADGNLRELLNRTPLGFVAAPEQLAPTILHLADSELSPYTTGQMMIVDGGATIRLGTE